MGPTDGTQVVKSGTRLSGQPSVETLKGSDSSCWTDCTAIGQIGPGRRSSESQVSIADAQAGETIA